ncbi:MAG: hypothetical protein Q9M75_07450 [Ghiorsea sp.]|nr:hypothetical protein [Ghiorsea sp.]MDQ6981216.1 hypothetical protein [Ghiorsea sp.]MDQ7058893.1 hypothetical protein [Ghiorsea sp.]
MLNQMENPTEMLAWLSQRNHHIPLEDLAFMMAAHEGSDYPEERQTFDLDDDFIDGMY